MYYCYYIVLLLLLLLLFSLYYYVSCYATENDRPKHADIQTSSNIILSLSTAIY